MMEQARVGCRVTAMNRISNGQQGRGAGVQIRNGVEVVGKGI